MRDDRGFALAATMMVLALISVLGAMAIQSATLEVQISAHDRDARAALYVAEAALEEARYYAARGWGKITPEAFTLPQAQLDLTIDTAFPPGFSLVNSRYSGFTLVDTAGRTFPVLDNSATTVTVDTSTVATLGAAPAAGRFLLVREGISGLWDGTDTLTVADAPRASVSSSNSWAGWVLWDDATPPNAYPVTASAVTLADEVELTLTGGSGSMSGPFRLVHHPWLSALAGGTVPEGDADAGNGAVWDRVFLDNGGAELGRAGVRAVGADPGDFNLISRGGAGNQHQTVRITVHRAGAPTQGTGDWVIEDG